ncbi:Ig-like domain repeat protein, partial [Nakamurella endophytica]|uniref:Ig-like domain repeat protein n=1 Tax=Nakamurella endophytica TaxID=1748367 RepID=UPI001E4A0B7D
MAAVTLLGLLATGPAAADTGTPTAGPLPGVPATGSSPSASWTVNPAGHADGSPAAAGATGTSAPARASAAPRAAAPQAAAPQAAAPQATAATVAVTSGTPVSRWGSAVRIWITVRAGRAAAAGAVVHVSYPGVKADLRTDGTGRLTLVIPGGRLGVGTSEVMASVRAPYTAAPGRLRLSVLRRASTVSVGAVRAGYGSAARLTAVVRVPGVSARIAGQAKLDVDGRSVALSTVAADGRVAFAVPAARVGVHSAGVTFYPAAGGVAARSRGVARLTVVRAAPRWAVQPPAGRPAFGSVATVRFTLRPPAAAPAGRPGGTVVLRDGRTLLGSAAVHGTAAVSFRVRVSPGVRTLTATYSGDANLTPSRTTFRLGVVRAAPSVTVSAPATAASGTTSTVQVRVGG